MLEFQFYQAETEFDSENEPFIDTFDPVKNQEQKWTGARVENADCGGDVEQLLACSRTR